MTALTPAVVDLWYERGLARHASNDEQLQWAALSQTIDSSGVLDGIFHSPEALAYVIPVMRLHLGINQVVSMSDPNNDIDTSPQSQFWNEVNDLRGGASLLGAAQKIVQSSDFRIEYGTTQMSAPLIVAFYNHILERTPSSGEITAWLNTGLDTAHVFVGFTESAEAKYMNAPFIDAYLQGATQAGRSPELPGPGYDALWHQKYDAIVLGITDTHHVGGA